MARVRRAAALLVSLAGVTASEHAGLSKRSQAAASAHVTKCDYHDKWCHLREIHEQEGHVGRPEPHVMEELEFISEHDRKAHLNRIHKQDGFWAWKRERVRLEKRDWEKWAAAEALEEWRAAEQHVNVNVAEGVEDLYGCRPMNILCKNLGNILNFSWKLCKSINKCKNHEKIM